LSDKNLQPAKPPDSGVGSFADVVDQHWSAVCRLLHHLTGNAHDTEDLAQETFLKAWKSRGKFQEGTNRRAWLLKIASNAFFDLRRGQKRSPAEPLVEEVAARGRSPTEHLETAEQAELLRAAMSELSDVARAVFHLRVTEELSFRETAEAVGVSEEAARWHMGQARRKLLARLEKSAEPKPK